MQYYLKTTVHDLNLFLEKIDMTSKISQESLAGVTLKICPTLEQPIIQ